ncbi:MAG: F0F1 ATP synthase subunit B [Phycisphaerae bacterium]
MLSARIKIALTLAALAALAWAAPVLAAAEGEGHAATGEAGHAAAGPSLFTGDLGNIFWTLLTFVVVMIVLGKFAWGPILGGLQKREAFIRDSLEKAKLDREQAEARLEEYEQRLAQAREEATAIVTEGRRDAEVVKRKIEDDAKAAAEAMIQRARREIGIATDSAVKELYGLSARLATDAASRIIRRELTADDHERLIAESIRELEAGGNGRSRN